MLSQTVSIIILLRNHSQHIIFICASVSPPTIADLSYFPFAKSCEHIVSYTIQVMGCKRDECIFLQIKWKSVLFGKIIIFLSYYPGASQSCWHRMWWMMLRSVINAENKSEVTDSKRVSSVHVYTVLCFSSTSLNAQSETIF